MTRKYYDRVHVIDALKAACKKAGTCKAWAQENGISPQYVSDVLDWGRRPGPKILHALGFYSVERYLPAPRKSHAS